jgi:hypothetical protein
VGADAKEAYNLPPVRGEVKLDKWDLPRDVEFKSESLEDLSIDGTLSLDFLAAVYRDCPNLKTVSLTAHWTSRLTVEEVCDKLSESFVGKIGYVCPHSAVCSKRSSRSLASGRTPLALSRKQ